MQSKIIKVNKEVFFNFGGYDDQEIERLLKFYTDKKGFLSPNIYIAGSFAKYTPYPNSNLGVQKIAEQVLAHCVYGKASLVLMVDNAANNGFATDLIAALNQNPRTRSRLDLDVLACKDKAYALDDLKCYFSTYGLKNYERINMEKPEQSLKGNIRISENIFGVFNSMRTEEKAVDQIVSDKKCMG